MDNVNRGKSKAQVMQARKLQAVEIAPVNDTHEVYLFIKANPNVRDENILATLGKDGKRAVVGQAIKNLTKSGHIVQLEDTIRNLSHLTKRVYQYRVSDMEYVPRRVVRKVAPNDKKAHKSAERIAKQSPAKPIISSIDDHPDNPFIHPNQVDNLFPKEETVIELNAQHEPLPAMEIPFQGPATSAQETSANTSEPLAEEHQQLHAVDKIMHVVSFGKDTLMGSHPELFDLWKQLNVIFAPFKK